MTNVFDHVSSRVLKGPTQKKGSWVSEGEAPWVGAIAGMCGSGKADLARNIYNKQKDQFHSHAWIELSQTVDVAKVFREMILQLSLVPSIQAGYSREEEELAHHVQEKLKGNKFLIVFIGLWEFRDWVRIKKALPIASVRGSRIIVTTEIFDVAEKCRESADKVHYLPLLQESESFQLLKDEVLKSEKGKMSLEDREDFKDLDLDVLKVHEPPFDTIAKLLMKCRGLKLAIKTVAQLLASRRPHQWGELCEYLPSLLYNNPMLNEIKSTMIRSYKGLPPYLKPCFLYLSIFPEDSDIDAWTIVNRWIAEGFVREKTGLSAKDVAVEYLSELFDRNLIKVSKVSRSGSCKTGCIHPLMRHILVMMAQEEKFSITVGKNKTPIVQAKRYRHVALDGQSDGKLDKYVDLSGIRSLTVFNKPSESIVSLICPSQMKTLRVLDFSHASFQVTQRDIRHIEKLYHLRYLNLCKSSICELSSSIGMLPFLEVLNVWKTKTTSLPSQITRLERLRVLRASRQKEDSCHHRNKQKPYNSEGVTVPKGIENLQCLEELGLMDVKGSSNLTIKALGELTALKYFRLACLTKKNIKEVSISLKKLSPSLVGLYLEACPKNGTLCCLPMKKTSLEFPRLCAIELDGHIGKMPEWIFGSLTLSVVKLYRTNLHQSDIKLMERMDSLINLYLLDSSYVDEKLVFYAGSFTGLRRLYLVRLPSLQVVTFEDKAAQQTREVNIRSCKLRLFGKKNLKKIRKFDVDSGVEVVN